ncbi:MAG TPA: TonB family protein [Bryobacteraceae bacterium]|nr:TonB family protein [Bryobacteraceae bacterium]
MNTLLTVFGREQISPRARWRSYLTSGLVHAGVIALLLIIPVAEWREVPAARPAPAERVLLLAPPPITIRAPRVRTTTPRPRQVIARRHIQLPPVVRRPAPKVLAKTKLPPAPVVTSKPVADLPKMAELKPLPAPVVRNPAPVIKPDVQQVKLGAFGAKSQAKGREIAHAMKIGGFGDPNGVPPSKDNLKSPIMMARLGGFEMPQGAGNSGGNGRSGASFQRTAFGDGGVGGGQGRARGGSGAGGTGVEVGGFGGAGAGNGGGSGGANNGEALKVGGFGEQHTARNQPTRAQTAAPATSPVVILYKPKPAYTAEAVRLHLEGEAALEVVFSASGRVRVVRVVHGLGHGLDQEAERAAMEIRFRPAMRGGNPVDITAMVRILFQLT